MNLTNSWHTKLAIGILLNDEKELEAKLDLLTAIELETRNEETGRICEELREQLCSHGEVAQEREELLPRPETDGVSEGDLRDEEPNEVHEEQ